MGSPGVSWWVAIPRRQPETQHKQRYEGEPKARVRREEELRAEAFPAGAASSPSALEE